MSKDGYSESRGRVTIRSLVPYVTIAVLSFVVVLYFRVAPSWNSYRASPVAMALPVVLMGIFYASILVALANFREMQGTVSGWFDVLGLMVAEGIMAYLVFASLIYVSLVIALCCLFVAYVNFAQSD
jgi:hypothetical protein